MMAWLRWSLILLMFKRSSDVGRAINNQDER